MEVSPELAEERGIQSGTWVQLVSRYGQVRVRALVTDRVHGRELYMPMNSVESPVNRLTSSHTDPATNTPAYKETSVHLNVLPEVGESPLPRINSRFGHPTPQNGVEVERKWKRPDYALQEMAWCSCRRGNNARRTPVAQPIPLEVPPRNPRAELHARLEQAPDEHAEAVLAAYEVLQELHDRGVLEIDARGSRSERRAS